MRESFSLTWSKKKLVRELSTIFKKNDHHLYLVGGAVRSLLLGQEPFDLDFTTDAKPQQVMKMFRKTIPTGIKHGTVTVIWKKERIEITTFREEESYSNFRHPDKVNFITSLKKDLSRRDFTINALAYDALTDKIYDYFQGQADLKRTIIKAIGNPFKRFEEDSLRILRACRFACVLEFRLEIQTYSAMKKLSYKLKHISSERIYKEFIQILKAKHPQKGLQLLEKIGFFNLFLTQNPQSQLWEKLNFFQDGEKDYLSRLLIFCLSLKRDERLAFLQALKFPNCYQKKVEHLCPLLEKGKYTFNNREARFFLSALGRENINLYLSSVQALLAEDIFKIWQHLLLTNKQFTLHIRELDLSGHDLIKKGLKGKEIGKALEKALKKVLNNPSFNKKDKLLELLDLKKN